MKDKKSRVIKEVQEIIAPRRIATFKTKEISVDKATGQVSIRIPKSMALRAGLNENAVAEIVFRPNKSVYEDAVKSELIIYFREKTKKEKKDGIEP